MNQPESANPLPSNETANFRASAGWSAIKTLLLFGSFMLAGILVLVWLGTPPAAQAVGQPFPTLDLAPLIQAEAPISNSDIKNKIALIHFWGTWCAPCKVEFPEFVALQKRFAAEPKLQFVSVSCSAGPEYDLAKLREQTAQFLAGHDTTMPTYCDSAGMTRTQLALLWEGGTFGYPTTVLVDQAGVIVQVIQGARPGEMLKLGEQIETLLKQSS